MSNGALSREIRGETLLLHPERALSWPARRLLVVADTHFGKSSVFARHGIAVPAGADALDRERIDALLQSTRSQRLLVLGDFLHGPVVPGSDTALQLAEWIRALHPVQLMLVTGNHDRTAATGWQAEAAWQGSWWMQGPFCFIHDVDDSGSSGNGDDNAGDAYRIGGHLHPVVALGAMRKRRPRIPVFWERPHALVLPSFGLFTGGFRLDASREGRVFATDAGVVVELRLSARRPAALAKSRDDTT